MSYPPDDHMLRALAIDNLIDDEQATSIIPIQDAICTDRGGVRLGVIATVVDVAAASIALSQLFPDRTATVTLSIQSIRTAREGPLIAVGRIIRKGSRQVLVDVDVRDGHGSERPEAGEACARSLVGFRRLPLRGDHAPLGEMPERPNRTSMAHPAARLDRPFIERAQLRVLDADAGIVEIDKTEWVNNSFGTLNGGMVATMLELAGEQAARAVLGPELVACDLELHYVGQGGDGPIRSRAVRTRVGRDHCVSHVELRDVGNENHLMAIGSVTSSRLP